MPQPAQITVDVQGLRDLSGDLAFVADEVEAVVKDFGRVPAPTVDGYGGQPAVDAMSELLSSWSEELALLGRACTMMSETAESTAAGWQGADEQAADSFDLFDWPANG